MVDSHHHIFAFWLGWDAALDQPALIRWRQLERVPPEWASDEEYQEALAEVDQPMPAQ